MVEFYRMSDKKDQIRGRKYVAKIDSKLEIKITSNRERDNISELKANLRSAMHPEHEVISSPTGKV
jgi:hypothetical protein